jgi:hypothetical protein
MLLSTPIVRYSQGGTYDLGVANISNILWLGGRFPRKAGFTETVRDIATEREDLLLFTPVDVLELFDRPRSY